jgi:hypothetical protein
MFDDSVGVVGLMGEKDDRGIGLGRDSKVEVRVAGARVFEATDPNTGAVFLNGDVFIDQDGGALAGESVDDHRCTYGDVVVAQDGIAEGSREPGDDLGAAVGSVVACDEGESPASDEVPGKQNQVGGEGIDFGDDVLKEVRLGVFVEMDVADLHDAIAVEGAGQIGDGDGAVDDVDLMAADLACVEGHPCGYSASAN